MPALSPFASDRAPGLVTQTLGPLRMGGDTALQGLAQSRSGVANLHVRLGVATPRMRAGWWRASPAAGGVLQLSDLRDSHRRRARRLLWPAPPEGAPRIPQPASNPAQFGSYIWRLNEQVLSILVAALELVEA